MNGIVYESAIVGFFPVAAINQIKTILRDLRFYGFSLSGFFKVAQMLVIQRAMVVVKRGEATQVSPWLGALAQGQMRVVSRADFILKIELRVLSR